MVSQNGSAAISDTAKIKRILSIVELTAIIAAAAAVVKAEGDRAAVWAELGLELTKNYRLDGNVLVEL